MRINKKSSHSTAAIAEKKKKFTFAARSLINHFPPMTSCLSVDFPLSK